MENEEIMKDGAKILLRAHIYLPIYENIKIKYFSIISIYSQWSHQIEI